MAEDSNLALISTRPGRDGNTAARLPHQKVELTMRTTLSTIACNLRKTLLVCGAVLIGMQAAPAALLDLRLGNI